jgi:hypothetical protein
VKRKEKLVSFSIYRKPTNTEKYIAADSFHPPQHKHAVSEYVTSTCHYTIIKQKNKKYSTLEDAIDTLRKIYK